MGMHDERFWNVSSELRRLVTASGEQIQRIQERLSQSAQVMSAIDSHNGTEHFLTLGGLNNTTSASTVAFSAISLIRE
ncbi:hypothetical protein HRbin36_01649 [bacterium HR36]|nr:hypothetical protein HRbin36_01649 [bacterium HR36]